MLYDENVTVRQIVYLLVFYKDSYNPLSQHAGRGFFIGQIFPLLLLTFFLILCLI